MAIKSFQKNLNSNRIIESENSALFTRLVPPTPARKAFNSNAINKLNPSATEVSEKIGTSAEAINKRFAGQIFMRLRRG